MKPTEHDLPPRLAEGEGAAAELLRKLERHPAHVPSEAAAWDRLLGRLARTPGRQRLRLGVIAAGAALASVVAMRLLSAPTSGGTPEIAGAVRSEPPRASRPVAGEAPADPQPRPRPANTGALTPRIQLGHAVIGLPVGEVELLGEARVMLAPGGSARASADENAATVELAKGTLDLAVEKRSDARAKRFDVLVGAYRFSVLGTRFEVARSGPRVTLSVAEGRVAVYARERLLAVVAGGGRWVSPAAEPARADATGAPEATRAAPAIAPGTGPAATAGPAPAPAIVPVVPPALEPAPPGPNGRPAIAAVPPAAPPSRCAARAGRDPRGALDCYLAEARGKGLTAEVALYEAARLRRETLGDAAGALAALREHRRRFPVGVLAPEVDLSIAEVLPKLGRYQEALMEVTALLDARPTGERLGELLLLRGHILREGLSDHAAAERAYAGAAETHGMRRHVGDGAEFWRAVCLEALGRVPDARLAYTRYLSRLDAAHAGEAKRRLTALDREHPPGGPAPTRQTQPGGSP
jgi:hypothetical protein